MDAWSKRHLAEDEVGQLLAGTDSSSELSNYLDLGPDVQTVGQRTRLQYADRCAEAWEGSLLASCTDRRLLPKLGASRSIVLLQAMSLHASVYGKCTMVHPLG